MFPRRWWQPVVLAALFAMAASVARAGDDADPASYEDLLLQALSRIQAERVGDALHDIESLVRRKPDFRLAQLIYADLLMARSGPISAFGKGARARDDKVTGLLDEARARWRYHVSPPVGDRLPGAVLDVPEEVSHVVMADLGQSRLFLFENDAGVPRLVDDFYISSGKKGAQKVREGDERTPVGVYRITSYLGPERLPDFYGAGAFPIDYPNEWDRRTGKTGSGIWLHGSPIGTYSRPPLASEGCIALTNPDFEAIRSLLRPGRTPVLVSERIEWISREDWLARRKAFRERVEAWRADWESRDTDRYLAHYSRDFRGPRKDYQAWAAAKRRINRAKSFIDVDLSEWGVYLYPGQPDLAVVSFRQAYRSNNYRSVSHKRQYWRRESDGVWRIVYEGPA